MDKSRAVYGIDLGTTYSCISQVDKFDQAVVLRNFEGDATTPSAVYFESADNIIVGKEAKGMLATEPDNTVVFIKREIGVDESYDKSSGKFPYCYDPTEISALILKKLVKDANDLGDNPEPIKDVVITCPAYFGTKERMQTKQAGEIAGLNVLAIINEPTAAAISYGMKVDERKTILVYDLGGGTFDVTIITVNGGAIKVIATGGDHHLGGVDWDTALAEYMLMAFNQENGTDYTLESNPELKYNLLLDAENKKKQLSAKQSVKHTIQYDGMSTRVEITRELFDDITSRFLDQTIDATRNIIEIAKQKGYDKIDEFLLVGGSSKMPQVKARITQEFGVDPKLTDPDECVAKGAAIYAMNEAYRNAVRQWEEGDSDEKPDPLQSKRTSVVNVTSKTYGIGIIDNKVCNYIFANTSVPAQRTIPLYTVVDNQTGLILPIFESDFTDEDADRTVDDKYCTPLSKEPPRLKLTKNWPKDTRCEVTMKIDSEGMLSITANIDKDDLYFELKIEGVKSNEEVLMAKEIIMNAKVE